MAGSIFVVFIFITLVIALRICRKVGKGSIQLTSENEIIKIKKKGFIMTFWSSREMRCMIAACVVIYFASFVLSSKIEVTINHKTSYGDRLKIDHEHTHHGTMWVHD